MRPQAGSNEPTKKPEGVKSGVTECRGRFVDGELDQREVAVPVFLAPIG